MGPEMIKGLGLWLDLVHADSDETATKFITDLEGADDEVKASFFACGVSLVDALGGCMVIHQMRDELVRQCN